MSIFGWCATNQHMQCVREYERFYVSAGGKDKGQVVWTGEKRHCECPKRSCECYKNRPEGTAPKKKTRRKQ